jgi:20S proteasome alpha/beta subunit
MTFIVGIRCKDGIVIGADSSVTFGSGPHPAQRTIEQATDRKIEIIGDRVIVAGTGFVGHQQRFTDTARKMFYESKTFGKNSGLDIGRALSAAGVADFASTSATMGKYAALAAYPSSDGSLHLCEFTSDGFQPEMKERDALWWVAIGSGQSIVDPFLALLRKVFWSDGPPSLRGGIFTALWALEHACELNTGGIQKPIHMATLALDNRGILRAKKLEPDALDEHENMIKGATEQLRSFRTTLEGAEAKEVPKAPSPPTGAAPKAGGILPGLPGGSR